MKKSAFARLCSISPGMVTKYVAAGRLALCGDGVDAKASLARLEGHLDEAKRRAALLKIAGIDPAGLGPLSAAKDAPASPGDGEAPALRVIEGGAGDGPASWRAERERADAQLKQLELLERCGALVEVAEVAEAISDAVAAFWTEVDRRHREDVAEIAAEAKFGPDQARDLRAWLARRDNRLRRAFADALREKAAAATAGGDRAETGNR